MACFRFWGEGQKIEENWHSRCTATVNAKHRLPSVCLQSTENLQLCCQHNYVKNSTFDLSLPWVLKIWMLFRVFSVTCWGSLFVKELYSAGFMDRTTEFGTPWTEQPWFWNTNKKVVLEHQQKRNYFKISKLNPLKLKVHWPWNVKEQTLTSLLIMIYFKQNLPKIKL